MKPFAMQSGRRLKLHWWVTSIAALAFFVWSIDLVPQIRSAATGTVASSGDSPEDVEFNEALEGDWSVFDNDAGEPETPENGLTSDDPLLHAIAGQAEPEPDDDLLRGITDGDDRAIADSAVVGASYETVDSDRSQEMSEGMQVIPADVAVQLRRIEESLRADRILDAHAELSRIYWKHPGIRHLIQEHIDRTASLIFTTPDRQFADPHFVEFGETLESIARQYDVPWMYLAMLNRVTPEKLQAGQQLKVVRGPFAAVVDLDEFALTVHAHGWYVHRYHIGTGRDHGTPTGEFSVQDKLENPTWYNPDGNVVDGDDPENPLGEYWLGLGNHIGIHGTIDPSSIGSASSRGCIHLNDEDIAEVFGLLGVGSKVLIRK